MAYIPTIHTFEDDVKNTNESNSNIVDSNNVDNDAIFTDNLLSTKKKTSFTKKLFTFLIVLLVLGSFYIIGYYFYSKWSSEQVLKKENEEALIRQQEELAKQNTGIENDLSKIFPTLSPGIYKYTSSAINKNNIIIITIKENDTESSENYSNFFGYILAHKLDLNKDLFYAFNIDNLIENTISDGNLSDINDDIFSDSQELLSKARKISYSDLEWESKTINNQEIEITNSGLTTLVYGYLNHKYAIFTTSLKDFFDTVNSLK